MFPSQHTNVPEVAREIAEDLDHQWDLIWERSSEELGGVSDADRQTVSAGMGGLWPGCVLRRGQRRQGAS